MKTVKLWPVSILPTSHAPVLSFELALLDEMDARFYGNIGPACPLVVRPFLERLFRFDDDYRIKMAVPVIFGDGVRRIVQPYTIYQEPVVVLAGC